MPRRSASVRSPTDFLAISSERTAALTGAMLLKAVADATRARRATRSMVVPGCCLAVDEERKQAALTAQQKAEDTLRCCPAAAVLLLLSCCCPAAVVQRTQRAPTSSQQPSSRDARSGEGLVTQQQCTAEPTQPHQRPQRCLLLLHSSLCEMRFSYAPRRSFE